LSGGNGTTSYKRPSSYLDSNLGDNDADGLYDISDLIGNGNKDEKRAKYD
jgi:hypothetical protein